MNVSFLAAVIGFAGLLSSTAVPARQHACPQEHERTRNVAVAYISSDVSEEIRAQHQVQRVPADQVRLLTSEGDSEVCRQITRTVRQHTDSIARRVLGAPTAPHSRLSYFQAGDYYVVVGSSKPTNVRRVPGGVQIRAGGWVPLTVLDRDFKVVASAAM